MIQIKRPAGRRERKREATRGKIIAAAIALFTDQAYEDVTIDEITEQADVAKGTFYLHFHTKEDLASAVYNDLIRPAAEAIGQMISSERSAREFLTELFRACAEPIEANPRLARAVFSHGMSQAYTQAEDEDDSSASLFSDVVEKIVIQGQKNGEMRNDRSSGELMVMLSVLFATTVWMWAGQPSSEHLVDRLEHCLETCFDGMAYKD